MFAEELATLEQDAANVGDSKGLYDIAKKLGKNNFHSVRPIKNRQGNLVTASQQQLERWKEHLAAVLNNNSDMEGEPENREEPVIGRESNINIDVTPLLKKK